MLTPAVASGAPLINGLVQGANLEGFLPDGFIDKAKETLSNVINGPAVGQAGDRLGDMIKGLRGGLLSKVGDMGGVGEMAEQASGLFPQGLKFPNAGEIGAGFSKIKESARSLM